MVDERDDKYELPDDGEYHFSDDQVNYDIEPEVAKSPESSVATGTAAVSGINQYRRPIIGVVVFVILIFLVYKLLAPASIAPTSDLTPTVASTANTSSKVMTTTTTSTKPTISQNVQQPVIPATTLPSTTIVNANPQTTITTTSLPSNPAMPSVPASIPAPINTQNTTGAETPIPTAIPTTPSENLSNMGYGETATTTSVEKMTLLQQQNTQLLNQLQTETAQRIATYQSKAAEMENKIQELSMHVSKIETTLVQLSKAIQDLKNPAAEAAAPMSAAGPMPVTTTTTVSAPIRIMPSSHSVPRIHYTVQAIIPGRAWLKSESGETITVAEGDTLKNAGRIMKIDPYDGIVEIDMNGRIISLSYGSNGD